MSTPHHLSNHPPAINARTASNTTSTLCLDLPAGNIVISKRTLIVSVGLCALLTLLSVLAATFLLYREWTRRKQTEAAKAWGRKSRYEDRISFMRKELDRSFTRQYSGCLHHDPENPEMGSDEPVEMDGARALCEVPAVPAQTALAADKERERGRGKKGVSLFFDEGCRMWLPKR